jgi:hypothetical protein
MTAGFLSYECQKNTHLKKRNMNKVVKIILGIAVTSFIVTQASAQNNNQTGNQKSQQVTTQDGFVPGAFVDEDKNGVCDNFESGRKVGRGRNFVDANKDGICDNRGSKFGKGRGQGNNCRNAVRNGHRGNRGNGNGYCRRGLNY